MIHLFIDPGINGTGWAFFRDMELSYHGVVRSKLKLHGKSAWISHSSYISVQVKAIATAMSEHEKGLMVHIEFPSLWTTSSKSRTSAEKGDLFKLAYLCGCLANAVEQIPSFKKLRLMSPSQWKGQLPKRVVESRVVKAFPYLPKLRDHEVDAIGMGLAFVGGKI